MTTNFVEILEPDPTKNPQLNLKNSPPGFCQLSDSIRLDQRTRNHEVQSWFLY